MILHLRARGMLSVVAVTVVLGITVLLLPGLLFAFPNLAAGGEPRTADLGAVLALGPVLAIALGHTRSDVGLTNGSRRRRQVAAIDLLLALVACGLAASPLLVRETATASTVARNVVGLTGLTVLALVVGAGRYAYLLPTGLIFASILFGFRLGLEEPQWWAWPLAPAESAGASILGISCGVLGLLAATSRILWPTPAASRHVAR